MQHRQPSPYPFANFSDEAIKFDALNFHETAVRQQLEALLLQKDASQRKNIIILNGHEKIGKRYLLSSAAWRLTAYGSPTQFIAPPEPPGSIDNMLRDLQVHATWANLEHVNPGQPLTEPCLQTLASQCNSSWENFKAPLIQILKEACMGARITAAGENVPTLSFGLYQTVSAMSRLPFPNAKIKWLLENITEFLGTTAATREGQTQIVLAKILKKLTEDRRLVYFIPDNGDADLGSTQLYIDLLDELSKAQSFNGNFILALEQRPEQASHGAQDFAARFPNRSAPPIDILPMQPEQLRYLLKSKALYQKLDDELVDLIVNASQNSRLLAADVIEGLIEEKTIIANAEGAWERNPRVSLGAQACQHKLTPYHDFLYKLRAGGNLNWLPAEAQGLNGPQLADQLERLIQCAVVCDGLIPFDWFYAIAPELMFTPETADQQHVRTQDALEAILAVFPNQSATLDASASHTPWFSHLSDSDANWPDTSLYQLSNQDAHAALRQGLEQGDPSLLGTIARSLLPDMAQHCRTINTRRSAALILSMIKLAGLTDTDLDREFRVLLALHSSPDELAATARCRAAQLSWLGVQPEIFWAFGQDKNHRELERLEALHAYAAYFDNTGLPVENYLMWHWKIGALYSQLYENKKSLAHLQLIFDSMTWKPNLMVNHEGLENKGTNSKQGIFTDEASVEIQVLACHFVNQGSFTKLISGATILKYLENAAWLAEQSQLDHLWVKVCPALALKELERGNVKKAEKYCFTGTSKLQQLPEYDRDNLTYFELARTQLLIIKSMVPPGISLHTNSIQYYNENIVLERLSRAESLLFQGFRLIDTRAAFERGNFALILAEVYFLSGKWQAAGNAAQAAINTYSHSDAFTKDGELIAHLILELVDYYQNISDQNISEWKKSITDRHQAILDLPQNGDLWVIAAIEALREGKSYAFKKLSPTSD